MSFGNAVRLHHDSIVLFQNSKYPSAFFLSILSQEEIGKMHMINDFVWRSRENSSDFSEFEKEWLELLYKHPHKQYAFFRNSPLADTYSTRGMAFMQDMFKGVLEGKKQGSVYVGLKRHKGKVDVKGKIRHPHQISKKIAEEQITQINDYLLVTGIGIKFDQFSLDNEEIEYAMKDRRFLKENFSNWHHMSHAAKKRIKAIQDFFKKIILPV